MQMNIANLNMGTRLGAGFNLLNFMMVVMATVARLRFTARGKVNHRIIENDWGKA